MSFGLKDAQKQHSKKANRQELLVMKKMYQPESRNWKLNCKNTKEWMRRRSRKDQKRAVHEGKTEGFILAGLITLNQKWSIPILWNGADPKRSIWTNIYCWQPNLWVTCLSSHRVKRATMEWVTISIGNGVNSTGKKHQAQVLVFVTMLLNLGL